MGFKMLQEENVSVLVKFSRVAAMGLTASEEVYTATRTACTLTGP